VGHGGCCCGGRAAPAREVPAGAETYLGTRDQLILGDTVLLQLSGKRYLAMPTGLNPDTRRERRGRDDYRWSSDDDVEGNRVRSDTGLAKRASVRHGTLSQT
jgi:hypothetical protein